MHHEISTFLWFQSNADRAARLYCEIFPGAKITSSDGQGTSFELAGQRYVAFNGGSHFQLTPAVSILITLPGQPEVDTLWDRFMTAGATPSRCGWLVDPFGLSWQVIPAGLLVALRDPDAARAKRALDAMLTQQKIDLPAIQRAVDR
jgi:predicted 3-demethylubiquinone-9 3-methyltransferase (glyoxalase superfamily)